MVAENLNHAAIGNHATGALDQHPLQFDRQLCHPRDARLDRGKPRRGDGGGARLIWLVRQAEKVADGIDQKARFTRMPNEGQPLMGLSAVKSLISRTAFSLRQEADLVILADRGHLDPRGQAKLFDGQHAVSACTFS